MSTPSSLRRSSRVRLRSRRSAARGATATLLLSASLGLAACEKDPYGPCCGGAFEAAESFRFDVAARGLDAVYLEGTNGDVRVVGGPDASTVVVRGTRHVTSFARPDAPQRLIDIVIDIYEEDGELIVRTLQPADDRDYSYAVHYELLVPEWFVASVYNVNGLVTVERLSSGTAIVNSNGPVDLRGIIGSAFVDNINGDIVADVAMYLGGFIDLRTVNGSILLDIPLDTSATFEAVLTNGEISVHNLPLRERVSGSGYLAGRLGAGEGEIALVTTNGNITVRGY